MRWAAEAGLPLLQSLRVAGERRLVGVEGRRGGSTASPKPASQRRARLGRGRVVVAVQGGKSGWYGRGEGVVVGGSGVGWWLVLVVVMVVGGGEVALRGDLCEGDVGLGLGLGLGPRLGILRRLHDEFGGGGSDGGSGGDGGSCSAVTKELL